MDKEIAQAVVVYIEILHNLNLNILKINELNYDDFTYKLKYIILNIVSDIYRLIPMKQFENKPLQLVNSDGILNYRKEFPYVETTLKQLLKEKENLLQKIRLLRNKNEHVPHAIEIPYSSFSPSPISFRINFDIKKEGETKTLDSKEIIAIITTLNIVFNKLNNEVCNFAENNNYKDYPVYKYLKSIQFLDFEKKFNENRLNEKTL